MKDLVYSSLSNRILGLVSTLAAHGIAPRTLEKVQVWWCDRKDEALATENAYADCLATVGTGRSENERAGMFEQAISDGRLSSSWTGVMNEPFAHMALRNLEQKLCNS